MYNVCIFAGTTEGRRLVELLSTGDGHVYACTATEYGGELVAHGENITVSSQRLSTDEMTVLFEHERFDLVVDATHPYAWAVTENIVVACEQTKTKYMRINRGADALPEDAIVVASIDDAAKHLDAVSGSALIVTGSKELLPYTSIQGWQKRLHFRVLPTQESIAACVKAGISPANIIAMQGPFSKELNAALIRSTGARYLVTKSSGASGGFFEKLEAARETGAIPIVIGRPSEQDGLLLDEAASVLCARFNITCLPRVSVIGIGMGSAHTLTVEAEAALKDADCVIGAKRIVESVGANKESLVTMDNTRIVSFIKEHPAFRSIAVVMSGDVGFYSGAKKLLGMLASYCPKVYPGISSVQYLCAKLGTSWDDARIISLHGRSGSIAAEVAINKKVFVLVGGNGAVKTVCSNLCAAGFENVSVSVGERLSYEDEQITTGSAIELGKKCFDPLSVMLIQNRDAVAKKPVMGLPDEAFVRNAKNEQNVPMTKSEIRAISVGKLMLDENSVVYDIGAGTGSVSVEMAQICPYGHVYSVECKEEAADLIEKNRRKFSLHNLSVIRGYAPDVCTDLPAPTHAFIGGSSGNMREIMQMLLDKNPNVRIVINVIAIETVAEVMQCIKEFDFTHAEIIQVSIAKAKALGRYHLMCGQNPITIFTCQRNADVPKQE